MSKFKLTPKRKKEIDLYSYFIEPKWKHLIKSYKTQSGKNIEFVEDPKGVSAVEGYFQITEQGKAKIRTKDVDGLLNILMGRVWADRMVHEIWGPMLYEGIQPLFEFKEELPENIYEYLEKKIDVERARKAWANTMLEMWRLGYR